MLQAMINIASVMRRRLYGKLHGGLFVAFVVRTSSSHRLIASYIADDRDLCLPHLHSTPPLGGFPSEYCHDVWYGKTRMVWPPDGEWYGYSIWQNSRTWRTDGRTDTAWRHRQRLHSIARHKCAMTVWWYQSSFFTCNWRITSDNV